MTILSVSTNDNMVYDLATTYYKDQEYDIQITLADGTAISKVFTYRTDCAQITGINAVRTSAGEARITYNSDEPGYFYYILRENGAALARVAFTAETSEATEAEIIRDGVKTEMKQHENVFTVTGLTEACHIPCIMWPSIRRKGHIGKQPFHWRGSLCGECHSDQRGPGICREAGKRRISVWI